MRHLDIFAISVQASGNMECLERMDNETKAGGSRKLTEKATCAPPTIVVFLHLKKLLNYLKTLKMFRQTPQRTVISVNSIVDRLCPVFCAVDVVVQKLLRCFQIDLVSRDHF